MPIKKIRDCIFTVINQSVMIDKDLAYMYGVETKILNQTVKRNIEHFSERFSFQLSDDERNEPGTNCDRLVALKHSSSTPYVFTEQGISMLSAVLQSKPAIDISIRIIDNYIDESILGLLTKRQENASASIYTKKQKQLLLDIHKYNNQYLEVEVKIFSKTK